MSFIITTTNPTGGAATVAITATRDGRVAITIEPDNRIIMTPDQQEQLINYLQSIKK